MQANFESTAFGTLSSMRQEPRRPDAGHARAAMAEPGPGMAWKDEVIRLLKDSLIKELVCVVRYNHLSEDTQALPLLSGEFLLHVYEELAHAHKLARRIAQLGGELEYSPNLLIRMGQATHDYHHDLKSMIEANLSSEYRTIVKYTEIMSQVDKQDVSTHRLLEAIVDDEREHAEELTAWLVN